MKSPCPKRPWICRLLTVIGGVGLFSVGVALGDLWGLVLMIVGLVPAVTGVADVSLLSEIRDERAHRLDQHRGSPKRAERRAWVR
jgi:hypothetical protein